MLFSLSIILVAGFLLTWVSRYLSQALLAIADRYHINPSIRGSIFDGIASSFPELTAVVVGLMAGSFEIGLGAIAGSAIFNMIVIPAASATKIKTAMKIDKKIIYREGGLFLITVFLLIGVLFFSRGAEGPDTSSMSRGAGLIAVALYVIYILFQVFQICEENDNYKPKVPAVNLWRNLGIIFATLAAIAGITHIIVTQALSIAHTLNIPEVFIGMTLIAIITSLPDLLLALFAAEKQDLNGAVANALGSNIFDILVGLGLPIAIVGGAVISWSENAFAITSLGLLSTIFIFWLIIRDGRITALESRILIGVYLAWIIAVGYFG